MKTSVVGIKHLIVLADESPDFGVRLDTALTMAGKFDARLTCIYAQELNPRCVSQMFLNHVPYSIRSEIAENMARFKESTATEIQKVFETKVTAASWQSKSRWRRINGDPNYVASVVSRYADLIICGQNGVERFPEFHTVDPGEVVAVSGRPVFVVPRDYKPKGYSAHVLFAWNGSREAGRAISDAMMILDTDTRVTIATVGSAKDLPESFGFDMASRLNSWGIETRQVDIPTNGDRNRGMALVRFARENGVDLIVMGAYSQSRLRQKVFGGVTQSVLKHMAAPVFLSH